MCSYECRWTWCFLDVRFQFCFEYSLNFKLNEGWEITDTNDYLNWINACMHSKLIVRNVWKRSKGIASKLKYTFSWWNYDDTHIQTKIIISVSKKIRKLINKLFQQQCLLLPLNYLHILYIYILLHINMHVNNPSSIYIYMLNAIAWEWTVYISFLLQPMQNIYSQTFEQSVPHWSILKYELHQSTKSIQ